MLRSSSHGLNKYEVSDATVKSAKRWENDNMYKTSYFRQSDKNVIKII